MFSRFASIIFLTFLTNLLLAQKPQEILLENTGSADQRAACNNKAGTCSQTLVSGVQTNDKKYLCKNDALIIKSTGTVDLSSDPIISTPAGVGYLILTCPPTKTGITIQDIASDPCLLKTPAGGVPANGFYVNTDNNTKGDAIFTNDGTIQANWGGGKPYKLYFAPITFDKLSTAGNAVYEGTPAGQCVNANTTAAFDVVYLNEVKSSIVSQGNLTGSFKAFGGLSEYDNGATNYTITISLKSNPAIKGTITSGNAKHNGTVVFTAPQNGTYVVDIQDGKSCGKVFEMTLSSAFDIDLKADTITCFGLADGSFTVIPVGGNAPYSFTWKKGAGAVNGPTSAPLSGAVVNSLDAGTYSVTATDNSGTTVTKTVTVIQASTIFSVTTSSTNPKCINNTDGSVTANSLGGFPPYYYSWSTGEKGFGKNTITNIGIDPITGANDFSVTVTDKAGCMKVAQTNLSVKTIVINKTVKNSTCSGKSDGEATVVASAGNSISGNYSFKWSYNNFSQVSKSSKLTGLKDGTYIFTVTDDNGCQLVDSCVVLPGKTLEMTPTVSDNKCFGDKAGKIVIVANTKNGIAATPYTFQFNPGNAGSFNAAGNSIAYSQLPAGKYGVTLTDQDGCTLSLPADLEVKQPTKLTLSDVTVADPTCSGGGKDGQIEIKAAGGTLAAGNNYKYKWNNTGTSPKIGGLSAGKFDIVVTDDNGCIATKAFDLKAPAAPVITEYIIKNVNCPNSTNGSINVKADPANIGDILTYTWSNKGNGASIFDLSPKKYSVTITDQKGCSVVGDTAVTAPAALQLIKTDIKMPLCTDSKDGSIAVSMAGGTKPYIFQWTVEGVVKSTSTDTVLTDLPGALYLISVTDAKGCNFPPFDITIDKPILTKVAFTALKEISCVNSGDCDGKATCTVTQFNDPNAVYNFIWDVKNVDVGKSSTRNNLCAGWNRVTITDGNCPVKDSVFIESPPKVSVDSLSLEINDVSCFGKNDGSALINGKGGVPPYTYMWATGEKTPFIKDQSFGTNVITIKDNNNCPFVYSVKIGQPDELKINTKVTDVTCFGYANGTITAQVLGGNVSQPGTKKYAFAWSNNKATDSLAQNLSGTTYYFTVTDSKGCTAIGSGSPSEPPSIDFALDTIATPICAGYTTEIKIKSASGGNGSIIDNYTYTIDDGPEASVKNEILTAYAGQHIIKVYDPNKCYAEKTIKIVDPPAIRVNLGKDVELELGDSYEINAEIVATAPIVKYTWTPTAGLTFTDSCKNNCAKIIRPFEDASFILQVQDTIGCVGADTIFITIDKNRNIYLPNIFSPNVDGTNDFMEVYADAESIESINYLRIFDRWGTMVFESPSFKPNESRLIGNRWDGFYKDIKANEGTYVYLCEVKFIDGVVLRFRGDVTLVR